MSFLIYKSLKTIVNVNIFSDRFYLEAEKLNNINNIRKEIKIVQ